MERRNMINNCCGFISCVCKILAEHAVDCKYRISATCAVPIECEHGCDVCSYCDACTCKPRDIQKLINEGYVQTSHRYRSVARLPEGKTAIQALTEADPVMGQDLMRRLEQWARSIYLRGSYPKDCLELTPDEFKEFKKLNGPVA